MAAWARASWALPIAALAIAIAIASSATPPRPLSRAFAEDGRRFELTLAERRAIFRELANNDARWRNFATSNFPGDTWAQADHWTDHMSQHVRQVARRRELSVAQVLLVYDEGLHAGWRATSGKALPATWPPLTTRKR